MRTHERRYCTKIFYRISPANEGLVFAIADDAFRNHAIRTALEASKTWGAFRDAVGEDEYQALLSKMSIGVSEPIVVPNNEDAFDHERIPGYGDGDYPEWLQTQMERFLPADIIAKFGERVATRLNGDYIHIDPSCENPFVLALRKLGYEVHRRDDLFFT
jgi:hypothetical protein